MKSPKTIWFILLLLICGSIASCGQVLMPEARVTIQAVDEAGESVTDANVGMGFLLPGKTSFSTGGIGIDGKTDSNGKFTSSAHCLGEIGYSVSKPGYYGFQAEPYRFPKSLLDRWEPYDKTFRVVLKKIGKPVPMYAKHINAAIPAFEVPLGFDLGTGDWVVPHGKGTVTDLIFLANLNQRDEEDFDYKLTVSFPNKGDGIQPFEAPYQFGCALKSPKEAPADGYLPQWVQTGTQRHGSPLVTNRDFEKHNFFFRVRTVVDEKGQIISGCYGKIYGDFMDFTYYLNPDKTRNLEFDPQHNLIISKLKISEEARDP
jgi:hypothetical protein